LLAWIQKQKKLDPGTIAMVLDLAKSKGISDENLLGHLEKHFGVLGLEDLSPDQGRALLVSLNKYGPPDDGTDLEEPTQEPMPPVADYDVPF